MSEGLLYICATPIGNMEDITLRAVRILKECDGIACEDTRHSAHLLHHLGIQKPLYSYHQHNEQFRSEEILERLEAGEQIALISDAGMPGISDPGFILVQKAQERGIKVTVLPGASAGISALVLSGLPCDRFVFEGFLPASGKERKDRLQQLKAEERTMILYESPHRLEKTLSDLYGVMGGRTLAAVRELTKIYEEVVRFSLQDREAFIAQKQPKGEYVLILEGAKPVMETHDELDIKEAVALEMEKGTDKKTAVKLVAKARRLPKNDVYMQVTDL